MKTYPRSVFGIPMIIQYVGNQYIVEVSDLGIITRSESKGRAIRDVFDKVREYLITKPIEPKVIEGYDFHQNVQIRMFKANQVLTRLGFTIIADEVTENDMGLIEDICNSIDINKLSNPEKQDIEDKLANIFSGYVMSPANRALNMNSLIMRAEHINKFSHLIEQANMSLLRGEFISTIMILIPVIEGVLLSLYGFDSSSNKPNDNQLLNKWAELEYDHSSKQLPNPFMLDEYIRAFIDIWQHTVFNKHQTAKNNSFFNRHYISHLMGEGNFYTRNNAYKMVLLVDLLAYVMAICHGQHHRFSYNTKEKSYIQRWGYYKHLALNKHNHANYHSLMREHLYYEKIYSLIKNNQWSIKEDINIG
ncbi:hypothetical protein HMPREF9412_3904 [Paenibacillus sp. HGF5]|nr:hypothetical protein HMPREF9412_3904 [Paenibacillus sp. HGF5]